MAKVRNAGIDSTYTDEKPRSRAKKQPKVLPPKLDCNARKIKRKFTHNVIFRGEVVGSEIRLTEFGRTKREAEKKLRKRFLTEYKIHTRPEPHVDLLIVTMNRS